MEINRDNYEKYLIDYLDGALSESNCMDLMIFLGQHPDLKMEMEGLDDIRLEPAEAFYGGKELLKKSLFSVIQQKQLSFDEVCVASMEGDLDNSEQELLLSYINEDPERQKEHAVLTKAVLEPDLSIVFEHKNRLRKPVFVVSRRIIYTTISAAAAILVLLFLLFGPDTPSVSDITSVDIQNQSGVNTEQFQLQRMNAISPLPILSQRLEVVPENRLILIPSLPVVTSLERINITAIQARNSLLSSSSLIQKEYIAIRSYTKYDRMYDEYLTPNEYLTGLIRKTITGKNIGEREEKPVIRELADAGIQKLEELTANNFDLSRSYDSEGNVQRFTLETSFFGFSTPRRQNIPSE